MKFHKKLLAGSILLFCILIGTSVIADRFLDDDAQLWYLSEDTNADGIRDKIRTIYVAQAGAQSPNDRSLTLAQQLYYLSEDTDADGIRDKLRCDAGGGAGTIEIQKDDAKIADADTVNFEGGLTVTDEGGGKVTVNVTGGAGGLWTNVGNILKNDVESSTQIDFELSGSPVASFKDLGLSPPNPSGAALVFGGGTTPLATGNIILAWEATGIGTDNDLLIGVSSIAGFANVLSIMGPTFVTAPIGAPAAYGIFGAYTGLFGLAAQGTTTSTGYQFWSAGGDTATALGATKIGGLFEHVTSPNEQAFGVVGIASTNSGWGGAAGVYGLGRYVSASSTVNVVGVIGQANDNHVGTNIGGTFGATNASGNAFALSTQGENYFQGWIRSHIATFGINTNKPNLVLSMWDTDQPMFDLEFRGTAATQEIILLRDGISSPSDRDFIIMKVDKATNDEYMKWNESLDSWDFSSGLAIDGTPIGGGSSTPPEVLFRDDFMRGTYPTSPDNVSYWDRRTTNGGTWLTRITTASGVAQMRTSGFGSPALEEADFNDICFFAYANDFDMTAIFSVAGAGGTSNQLFKVGLIESSAGGSDDYIYIEHTGTGTIYLKCSSGGTSTTSATGHTFSAGTVSVFRIWADGTGVHWSVDGTQYASVTTNIPAVAMQPLLSVDEGTSGQVNLNMYTYRIEQDS